MAKKKIDIELNVKTGKAAKDLKSVDAGLKGIGGAGQVAGKGFKVMGTAMKAAGIGIIVTLFAKLVEQLQKNQKFMDAMNKIFLALEPILIAVAEVIAIVVDGIASLIGITLSAISGTEDMTDSLVEQRKQVTLLEAELGLLQLQYQREAELMRQIRDDESLSIQERIDANYELGKVLEEQLQRERDIAEESLFLAEVELSRNKNNVELQVQLLEAKTKLAEIDERITGQRSEQLVNLNSLEREREAQQKEAARAREDQLQKEAKMLQDLIDLQNEDIKVKKKANRDLNAQFENAEEANAELLKQIKEKMQAELNALNSSVKNAKVNINAQNEQTEAYKLDIEEKNKEDEKRQKKILQNVKADLKLFRDTANEKGMRNYRFDYIAENEKTYSGLLNSQGQFLKLIEDSNIKSFEDLIKLQEEFEQQNATNINRIRNSAEPDFYIDAVVEDIKKVENEFENYVQKIQEDLESQAGIYNDITQTQLETSEQSAEASVNIINNSANKKLEIEQKYAEDIKELESSLGVTKEELQLQADQELFLHFEEAQEKEIRLAEEKYDRLLGLAQGNAEATEKLEQEKANTINEINTREQKQAFKIMRDKIAQLKKEKELEKNLERQAGMETLQMGMDLAKEGTATFKAVASAETIMATYMGATKAMAQVPFPFNFAQAGLIIATGIKNLAEISKTEVPGGGDGGGASMPDTVTEVGGDMTGDVPAITFGAAGSETPPVQAFVVETDISNAQALQSELDLQSTL
jgi:hypothetical protein|tara:strand:- start:289 stop:2550 length:2262 start_codon:yes stop_codon:yes gene_type:complete